MKILRKVLPGIVLLASSLPAFASHCPSDMKKIDAALASNPSVSASTLTRVKELRESGEMQHKSGNHSQSIKDLHEAMGLLGLKVE
ncbi:MAG TPA: hypothetical protein VKB27_08625 [Gammaproteobacteria bacterium]|nr:hypothetical protein [Gammaproteobacteria bacterium]